MNAVGKKTALILSLTAALFALFLHGAPRMAELTLKGLRAFLFVMPSVFPPLILSGVLISSGAAEEISRRLGGGFSRFFALPRAAFPVFLLGLIAGFPTGAKCCAQLYEEGGLTEEEAERLAAFTNFCAPPFLVAGVGQAVFGSMRFGWALYLCQTVFAVIFGFFYKRPKNYTPRAPSVRAPGRENGLAAVFTSSLSASVEQILKIGGYIVFFTVLSGTLSDLFARFWQADGRWEGLFSGFWELSSGVAALKGSDPAAPVCAGALVGFSGVSVLTQCASFLRARGLSAKGLIPAHLLCACVLAAAGAVARRCGIF